MAELLTKLPRQLITLARDIVKGIPGGETYLVGGAVRDIIMGHATKDYDLVVRGVPADTIEARLAEKGKVSLVGKTFGVFKWQPDNWTGDAIDVALPRTEHVTSGTGQYRDFAVQSNPELPIEEDLARRDFTVNALALNLVSGELVDPNGRRRDITDKLLRTVGDPAIRFAEDLSRTLRGVRFACQLGFAFEPETWGTIRVHGRQAASGTAADGGFLVPREIVAREVLKSLVADAARALELLDDSGFLHELLPEVTAMKNCPQPPEFHTEGDVFAHTKLALQAFTAAPWRDFFGETKPSLNALIGVLLHDIGKPLTLKTPDRDGVDRIRTNEHDTVGAALVAGICERLKLTSHVDPEAGQVEPEIVAWLVQHHLLVVHGPPEVLKPATIYRYFLHDAAKGLALQQLIFADSWSTRPADGRDLTQSVRRLQERVHEVTDKLEAGKLKLLLSGDDIMAEFNLTRGPKIGDLLRALEEAQLEGKVKTRDEATAYLKQLL